MHMCACLHGGQRTLGGHLYHDPVYTLDTESFTEFETMLAASKLQWCSCLCLPQCWGHSHVWCHIWLPWAPWNLNSSSRACRTSVLIIWAAIFPTSWVGCLFMETSPAITPGELAHPRAACLTPYPFSFVGSSVCQKRVQFGSVAIHNPSRNYSFLRKRFYS